VSVGRTAWKCEGAIAELLLDDQGYCHSAGRKRTTTLAVMDAAKYSCGLYVCQWFAVLFFRKNPTFFAGSSVLESRPSGPPQLVLPSVNTTTGGIFRNGRFRGRIEPATDEMLGRPNMGLQGPKQGFLRKPCPNTFSGKATSCRTLLVGKLDKADSREIVAVYQLTNNLAPMRMVL